VRYLACFAFAAVAWAQGTEPKAKADDYEVHERVKRVEIGAEYMVTSVAGPGGMYVVPDHLVVEVALFPPKGEPLNVGTRDFELLVDGKTLRPGTAQMVVAAIQRSEWRYPRGVQATAGMGNDTVVLGGPTRQAPPWGGPTRRTPTPPRAPAPEDRSGLDKPEPVKVTELVVSAALPDGEFKGPVSGFLYFPFQGKASKIRAVTLVYGDTKLKLK
jgi:hypothetical protein